MWQRGLYVPYRLFKALVCRQLLLSFCQTSSPTPTDSLIWSWGEGQTKWTDSAGSKCSKAATTAFVKLIRCEAITKPPPVEIKPASNIASMSTMNIFLPPRWWRLLCRVCGISPEPDSAGRGRDEISRPEQVTQWHGGCDKCKMWSFSGI